MGMGCSEAYRTPALVTQGCHDLRVLSWFLRMGWVYWSIFIMLFLVLARYVPNVAKRSIWDQCKKKYILRTDQRPATDDRPTTSHLGKLKWPFISARGRTIQFMFGSTVGFSGSADRIALFSVSPNPRWRLARHLQNFKWRYLCGGSFDLLRVWF